MSDPQEDYDDRAGSQGQQGSGLRACDRVQIVGWVGLFQAFVPGVVAILYLGHPDRWQARESAIVLGLAGALTLLYAFAGGFLVVRSIQIRPEMGDAVRFMNILIVLPVVALLSLFVVGPIATTIAICVMGGPIPPMLVLVLVVGLPNDVLLAIQCWRNRRKVLRAFHAWLDPSSDG